MTQDIHNLLAERTIASAGKMALLDLESVKLRLGPKWDKLSGLVHAFFETAIKRSITPGDTFLKMGDLTYIVVYRDLSVHEAQARCAVLSQEVCRRLFGEQGVEITVRSIVGHIDSGVLRSNASLEAAIDDTLERFGSETIVSATECKPSSVLAPPTTPRLNLQFTQQKRPRFPCSEEQLSFVYRPLWDCARKVILTYVCQPVPPGFDIALASTAGFATIAIDDDDRTAEERVIENRAILDLTILNHCTARIKQLRKSGARVLFGVPIHFSTLTRPKAWTRYNAIYRTIEPDILRDMVFIVFEFDGNVPNIRLIHEMPKLSRARHIFCAMEHNDQGVGRFASTGIYAVGTELPRTPSTETEMLGNIKTMAKDARHNGFESCVFSVTNKSRALNAIAAGVRYLEGPAIHSVIADPHYALVHELEDLYQHRAIS